MVLGACKVRGISHFHEKKVKEIKKTPLKRGLGENYENTTFWLLKKLSFSKSNATLIGPTDDEQSKM